VVVVRSSSFDIKMGWKCNSEEEKVCTEFLWGHMLESGDMEVRRGTTDVRCHPPGGGGLDGL
jgi:hypothetical protein